MILYIRKKNLLSKISNITMRGIVISQLVVIRLGKDIEDLLSSTRQNAPPRSDYWVKTIEM